MNNRANKREMFRVLNEKLRTLDSSLGSEIICPLCWKRFSSDSLPSNLTIEHIPPLKVAKLIGEDDLKTLTCKDCNNIYGTKCENDVKNFLIHQLHYYGKYSGPIKGTIASQKSHAPLRSNIVLGCKELSVTGVPKANNPAVTQEHVSIWKEIVENHIDDWHFTVELNYRYKLPAAWAAYLKTAYMAAFVFTDCAYPFENAGTELRKLLVRGDSDQVGPCIIEPCEIGVGGKPWIAEVTEPDNLRCLWVKVMGNIVILPLPYDSRLTCYDAWQRTSAQTGFGLRPQKVHFRLKMSDEDAAEAQKCLPALSKT